MKVQGFEITSQAIDAAFWLLSKLLGVDVKELEQVVLYRTEYRTVLISKQHGKKKRRLDIPPIKLRKMQRLLLKKCLCHLKPASTSDWEALTGYKTGCSIRNNIEPHLNGKAFLQLDLADAFPSVTTRMVRDSLEKMFEQETVIKTFRFKEVRWFRKKFITQKANPKQQSTPNEPHTLDVLWALREIIIWLTTFEDKLPQGAPTSPHLFNLVVAHQQLPTIVRSFQRNNEFVITVYADNITVSVREGKISPGMVEKMISAIELQTPFHVNREKTRLALAKRGSPNITGLSVGKRTSGTIVTVPGSVQRRARGLLHSAIFNPQLRRQALGMIAYLLDVYGSESQLPAQIKVPYEKLLSTIKSQQKSAHAK